MTETDGVRGRAARRYPRPNQDDPSDPRSPAERDRDRILYSSAFRRLSGITQVTSPGELYLVHNRLTHSLKVAQVGRSLAGQLLHNPANETLIQELGGLDRDVVEAAALAHDLGHPPFGHVAETELDKVLTGGDIGPPVPAGYDGNAQSFRIVTKLAVRYQHTPGLNLTRATLRSILKYPWTRHRSGARNRKWGVFPSEIEDFNWCRQASGLGENERSLEAQLMDWADDIAYAVHDVEDFFRAGLIPLDRFTTDSSERGRFLDATATRDGASAGERRAMEEALLRTEIVDIGVPAPFRGSQTDRAALRGFTSSLISRYVNNSISLQRDGSGKAALVIDAERALEVKVLKALTWHYVIESPSLMSLRFGQRRVIRSLFSIFYQAEMDRDRSIFPVYFRDKLETNVEGNAGVKRIVADLISGMSEAQAVAVHQRLTGQSLGSALDMYLQ